MTDSSVNARRSDESLANAALGLAAVAVILWVGFAIADVDNAAWLLIPVAGLAAAILGWRAGAGSRPTGKALVAVVVGLLAAASVIAWVIVDALK